MKSGGDPAGYRAYALPDFLPELERGGTAVPAGDRRLIVANRETLIWAQRLEGGIPAVLKMYRRRGEIIWQREKRFRFRVQREFNALAYLDTRGVPCSQPIFWSRGCSPQFGRYEILATREIENVAQLDTLFSANDPAVAAPSLRAAYELIRRMHQSGCHHGRMFGRNILVARWDTQPEAYILDMPNAILFPYDITGTRMAWMDLYFLTVGVAKRAGAAACREPLRRYGLGPGAIDTFVDHVHGRRVSHLTKTRFRVEAEIWELLARAGVRCGPSRHLRG